MNSVLNDQQNSNKPNIESIKPNAYTLYTYEECPLFLKDTTCTLYTGYRPQMGYIDCIKSIFYLHNQWGNIWTFIIKIPLSALACIILCTEVDDLIHRLPFIILFVSCLSHTPVSILYHIFMCVSPEVKLAWNRADYACIFIMIMFTTYALGCYPFYCNQSLQIAQIIGTGVPALLNIILSATPMYKKARTMRTLRTCASGIVITLALMPVFYSAVTNGLKNPYYSVIWGFGSCIFYIIGGSLWVLHIPEKIIPYVFDKHLNSHTCMHICIVISHLLFYMFVFREYQFLKSIQFKC